MVVERFHALYKTEDCKGRQTTIHHDQLKVCRDTVIPLWLGRCRHDMLDLDVTIPYDLAKADTDSPPVVDEECQPAKDKETAEAAIWDQSDDGTEDDSEKVDMDQKKPSDDIPYPL